MTFKALLQALCGGGSAFFYWGGIFRWSICLYYPSLRIVTSSLYLFVFCLYKYLSPPLHYIDVPKK